MIKKYLLFCFGIALLLCGCSVNQEELQRLINGNLLVTEESQTEEPDTEPQTEAESDTEPQTEAKTEAEFHLETKAALRESAGQFCYDRIDTKEQQLYKEILAILSEQKENVRISSLDPDQADLVFQYVCNDHPELFYVNGYTMSKYVKGSTVTALFFSGKYTKTPEEREYLQNQIEHLADQCLAGMPDTSDEYEKAKYIYEFLIENTEYDVNAPENQNICSVFLNGKSVCQGYAKSTQYLLQHAGIECTLIVGTLKDGGSHAWNLAKLNGEWCYIDTTGGDASYLMEDGSRATGGINYFYFGTNDEKMDKTHSPSTNLMLPACDSLANYYYVHEGKYLDRKDFSIVEEIFARADNMGDEQLAIQCSDSEVYAFLIDELITKRGFYRLRPGSSSLHYVRMDESCTLICYL